MPLGTRLLRLIKDKGLKKSEFARMIDVNHVSVSNIINQKNKNPQVVFFEKIAETFPEVSIEWLITGRGGMYRGDAELLGQIAEDPEQSYGLPEEEAKTLQQLVETQQKLIHMMESRLASVEERIKDKDPGLARELDL